MADDPKAGGPGEAVAEPAAPSAEPEKKPEGETDAQRIARLEAENEAHRKTQAEWQPKVELANKILEERKNPPPTAQPSGKDPLEERLRMAEDAVQRFPDDPAYLDALDNARARIAERDWKRAADQVRPEFEKMPEKYRALAGKVWVESGGRLSPADCLAAAKGKLGLDDAEVEKLRKENEELKKDSEARKRGVFVTGGTPVLEPKSQKTLSDGTAVYTPAEWKKIDTLPHHEKVKLLNAYKAGKVLIQDG